MFSSLNFLYDLQILLLSFAPNLMHLSTEKDGNVLLLTNVLLQRGTGIYGELNASVKVQHINNNKYNNSLQIKLRMCSHNETIAHVEYD
jgi:hypothetical protein